MKIIATVTIAMVVLLVGCDPLPQRIVQQQPAPASPVAPVAPTQAPAANPTQVKPTPTPTTEAPKPTTPRPVTTEPVKTTRPVTTTTPTTKPTTTTLTTTPATTTTANVTAEDNLKYTGTVIAMGPTVWQISDKAFTINKDTDLGDGLKVGDQVEVRYREVGQVKLARKIELR